MSSLCWSLNLKKKRKKNEESFWSLKPRETSWIESIFCIKIKTICFGLILTFSKSRGREPKRVRSEGLRLPKAINLVCCPHSLYPTQPLCMSTWTEITCLCPRQSFLVFSKFHPCFWMFCWVAWLPSPWVPLLGQQEYWETPLSWRVMALCVAVTPWPWVCDNHWFPKMAKRRGRREFMSAISSHHWNTELALQHPEAKNVNKGEDANVSPALKNEGLLGMLSLPLSCARPTMEQRGSFDIFFKRE